jgi:hypothetical protein
VTSEMSFELLENETADRLLQSIENKMNEIRKLQREYKYFRYEDAVDAYQLLLYNLALENLPKDLGLDLLETILCGVDQIFDSVWANCKEDFSEEKNKLYRNEDNLRRD